MTPDVLVVTVPIEGSYPSVNQLGANGHRAGKKSAAYKRLFSAVKDAASAEMLRTGWTTISDLCDVTVTRYVTDHRRRDCSNLAKCELDAMTAAGVWNDDSQTLRVGLEIVYDAGGCDRVVIVVRRMYREVSRPVPRELAKEILADGIRRPKARQRPCSASEVSRTPVKASISSGPQAFLNGKAISRSEALEMIRGSR